MNQRPLSLLLLALMLLGGAARRGAAQSTPVYNPANGHWYQLVRTPAGLNWPDARAAAEKLSYAGYPGHLATITTADERQFINANVTGQSGLESVWLGGYQDSTAPDYREPDGGWRWVTGEPFQFTNWHAGEPNDSPHDSNALELAVIWGGQWDDRLGTQAYLYGYVVEYEPLPVGGAASTAGLSLFPNPALGGQPALGQVTLAQPAGAGGEVLSLTSSNPAAAVVPASVTVPGGASSATFVITTLPVAAPTPVLITAACSFGPTTATLQVLPLPGPPPPATGAGNLLVNGSFEAPHVPDGNAIGGVSGSGLPGWQITRGNIDVVSGYWQPAPDGGSQSIDLVGSPGAATIEQTFPTLPGRDYLFSGWVSHNWVIGEGRADVSLNGIFFEELYQNIPNTDRDMHWMPFAYRFRAATAATTLAIADVTGVDSIHGTALDGLSVTLAPGQNPPGVSPPAGLPAPTNLSAQLLIEARTQLAWTAPSADEDGFAIWRKTSTSDWTPLGVTPPHATTFLDPGVGPSATYRYRVRAIRGSLTSEWSNEASLTTPAAPSAPTGLRVDLLGTTLVSLLWSADGSNATAMTVFRQTTGGDWTLVGERQPFVRQYTDRGLIPNTRYTYRVVAHNNYFVSAGSNEVRVTTLGP